MENCRDLLQRVAFLGNRSAFHIERRSTCTTYGPPCVEGSTKTFCLYINNGKDVETMEFKWWHMHGVAANPFERDLFRIQFSRSLVISGVASRTDRKCNLHVQHLIQPFRSYRQTLSYSSRCRSITVYNADTSNVLTPDMYYVKSSIHLLC